MTHGRSPGAVVALLLLERPQRQRHSIVVDRHSIFDKSWVSSAIHGRPKAGKRGELTAQRANSRIFSPSDRHRQRRSSVPPCEPFNLRE
jgi:hypothetical protein